MKYLEDNVPNFKEEMAKVFQGQQEIPMINK